VIVVAAMFMTAEYCRGLIRITLTASPRRGQVLAAKAVVIGLVTFVAGLAGAGAAVPLGERLMRSRGSFILPVGSVLGLLYLFPIIGAAVTDPHWNRHLEQIGPMSAGLAIQATTGLRSLPISPWAGLGVLAAWAAAALLAGGLLLGVRDA
jgi:ABC-2 type transport system permease protein